MKTLEFISEGGVRKMIDLTTPIIPYIGTGIFLLNENYSLIKKKLIENKIKHREKILPPDEENSLEWKIIDVMKCGYKYEVVQLFFAKDRLFKICLWEDFQGNLPNGIHTRMQLLDAEKIDPKLERDEECDELFKSPDGYWLEYSNGTGEIINITIFIPELEHYDL